MLQQAKACFMAVGLLLGLCALIPAPARAYTGSIISGLQGYCLDIGWQKRDNGSVVGMWPCNSGANQQFTPNSNGEIRVYGNKCLDDPGARGQNGDRIQIWDCNGGKQQKWKSTPQGEIRSFNNKCLDISNRNPLPGAAVELWDCNGGSNQKWAGATFRQSVNFSQNNNPLSSVGNKINQLGSAGQLVGGGGAGFTMPIGNNLANVTPLSQIAP